MSLWNISNEVNMDSDAKVLGGRDQQLYFYINYHLPLYPKKSIPSEQNMK